MVHNFFKENILQLWKNFEMKKIQLFLGLLLAAVQLANARIPSPTDCIIDELRPNPSNPHTFYSCTPYGPVLFQCPGELYFSVRQNKCDYILDSSEEEDQSSESEEEGLESTTDNDTEVSPVESSEEEDKSSSEEESSSEEITTIKTSPPTTTSNSISTSTDNHTTTTETTTKSSTEPPETTTQKITTTTTIRPSTTTKPSTTTTKQSTTTTRKTTIRTTTTRPPGAIICEPGRIYYPDPTTCSKFYQCANGIPYRFSCPSGLNFNPNINVCDWPWNYPCPL